MSEERFEQSFQVATPANLVVKNIRGSVDIRTGDPGAILVTAIRQNETGDTKHTEIELRQDAEGTVHAVARFPEGSIDWLFGTKPCKVDFIIRAPRQCSLKVSGVSNDAVISGFEGSFSVKAVSGDLTLQDLVGELNVNTVSGDVDLEAVNGRLNLHTVSGSIKGRKASGCTHLNTVSGDVQLLESNLPEVSAESVSGDLLLQTSLQEGPYRFHSVSGTVHLSIPPETQCSAELHSLSGRITASLPLTSSSRDHGTHLMEVQGGGVKVLLNSVSGDLSLAG